jgi:hypothetical protein
MKSSVNAGDGGGINITGSITGAPGGDNGGRDGSPINITGGKGGDVKLVAPSPTRPFLGHPLTTWVLGVIGTIVVAIVAAIVNNMLKNE